MFFSSVPSRALDYPVPSHSDDLLEGPMVPVRLFFRFSVALIPIVLNAQVPPQALPILKKLGTDLVKKALTPSMQVESFTLGGFKATAVECASDATPEAFSGQATFHLPPPLGPTELTFKGLVLKGGVAEGHLEAPLKGAPTEHQGWTYRITHLSLSHQGSRVEGTATLAGIQVDLQPLTLTPQGLQGVLTPGDLPLAEGPFTAELQKGRVTFGPNGVRLGGHLIARIPLPVRHAESGLPIVLDGGSIEFESTVLTGTSTLAPNLAKDLPILHRGLTWELTTVSLGFERGTPTLGGPTRVRFPLETFCRVGATDQAYRSEPLPCHLRGRVPQPGLPSRVPPQPGFTPAWEGFSGTFILPPAQLHPSGLTTYRFEVQKGSVRVDRSRIEPMGSRLTGRVSWGPNDAFQTRFTEAVADLSEGLYVSGSPFTQPIPVGAYRVHTPSGTPLCDFSTAHSPEALPPAWMGIFLPSYHLALPSELYTFDPSQQRIPILVQGKQGRFEANGHFSGSLGVHLPQRVMLFFAPVALEPFELHFQEGALVLAPLVKGTLHLVAQPLLTEDFQPPLSFRLSSNGVEGVELHTQASEGPTSLSTQLVGVRIAVESARLQPNLLDLSGFFTFALEGADLPTIPFDHLVLEAVGGPLEGKPGAISLTFKGGRWCPMPDRPTVTLWGFPFTLAENGYGTLETPGGAPRFYVGLGGDLEAHPILPSLTQRLLFTTNPQGKGVVELERPFHVDHAIPAMGSLTGDLGFHVQTASDQTLSEAYFEGNARLKLQLGDGLDVEGGMRFGRAREGTSVFPYFYALGHLKTQGPGITVAPNLELYGFLGGFTQNFLPDEIRNTDAITGKTDPNLGLAVMAGVDAGTLDRFTLDANLDLYLSQNLTTVFQGKGWLFGSRGAQPSDRQVSADIRFTRDPDTFHASLEADLNFYGGLLHPMGRVELHFGPDAQYLHVGTPAAPISIRFLNAWEGWGYLTADWNDGSCRLGAGGGVTYRKSGDFGIVYGEAWLTARGDLLIEVDAEGDPRFLGVVGAEGGASFGMRFKTYKVHKITIFSGSLGTNLAFQVPGHPTFSGSVTLRYRVLGGAFKGSVSAHLDL